MSSGLNEISPTFDPALQQATPQPRRGKGAMRVENVDFI